MKKKQQLLALFVVLLVVSTLAYGDVALWASSSNPVPSGTSYSVTAQAYGSNWSEAGDLTFYKDGTYLGGSWFNFPQTAEISVTSVDYGNKTVVYQATSNWYSDDYPWNAYYEASLNVNIVAPAQAPLGAFDQVTSSVLRGQTISASGWAVDYEMGAPIDHVDYHIDGNYAGQAGLGGYRPDVQNANVTSGFWSPADVTWSGWSVAYNTAGLAVGNHSIRIVAWDNQGLSADLGTMTFAVTPIPQSITFNNPGTQTYGTPLALNASASSGLPVSYSISGPAYLSDNTLYFTALGTVTVTAMQAGNSSYSAATGVTVSFTVAAGAGNSIPSGVKTLLGIDPNGTPSPDTSGGFKVHKP